MMIADRKLTRAYSRKFDVFWEERAGKGSFKPTVNSCMYEKLFTKSSSIYKPLFSHKMK